MNEMKEHVASLPCVGCLAPLIQWIGLRENLQETIDFLIKYGVFLYIFPYVPSRQGFDVETAWWFPA
jgi:hypothetical protein